MNKQQKKYLLIGIAILVLFALGSTLFSGEILSVDRIWLHQRGVGQAGDELKDGVWRITATSQSTKVQFLQINEDVMKANQEEIGDFPSDLDVNGEIYVTVSQPYNPYWVIPVNDLGIVEVVPQMQGVHLTNGPSGAYLADSDKVRLWSLNLAQKKVVIPFEVTAAKIIGENTGWLKTDDPRGKQITNQEGWVIYSFEISQSDIVAGDLSEIIFYNPNDSTETFKINLQWAFGDYDRYSWDENFLFVTPENIDNLSPTQEITFLASNEQAIRSQLNWQSGNDWTFCRYWYGGGNVFQGTAIYEAGLFGDKVEVSYKVHEVNGKPFPFIDINKGQASIPSLKLLSEGFVSGTTEATDIFEYAGWYTPHNNAVEKPPSISSPNDWKNWRYPLTPNVFADTASTPIGKGILNYLAGSNKAPVTGYTHSAFPRRNPDIWGSGIGGNIGVNGQIGVVLPSAARSWLFTLDISTQLVDTVVVREDYINVDITQPLSFDRYTLNAGETATGTVKLRNTSPYSGTVSVGIQSPDNLKYTAEISGGDGAMDFNAGEEKTVTFTIKNTGLLDEQLSGTFRFSVTNQQPRETASQSFSMTFKPGLGIPNSLLDITTMDAETGTKVSGIAINARYGVNSESSRSGTTSNGECVLDLGKYEGPVTVVASDYQGRYNSKEVVVQVKAGNNPLTIHLIPKGSASLPFDWTFFLVGSAVVGIALLVFMYWRKKGFGLWK